MLRLGYLVVLFRRIRGRIVPIKDDKNATHQRRKDAVVGATAIGAGGTTIAAGTKRGRAFQDRFNDFLYGIYTKSAIRERKQYVKANNIKEWNPTARVSADDVISVSFPNDMIKKYGPSLSPNWEKKSYIPRGVSIDMADGNFYDFVSRKITVRFPVESTFLHELGHAQQWEKGPPLGHRFESAMRDRTIESGDRFLDAHRLADESRGKVRGAINRRYFKKGLLKEASKLAGLNVKTRYHSAAMQTYEALTKVGRIVDEADAWRRAAVTAYKAESFGGTRRVQAARAAGRVLRKSIMPMTSYALALTKATPRYAYVAAGASAIAYGAYRLIRRPK